MELRHTSEGWLYGVLATEKGSPIDLMLCQAPHDCEIKSCPGRTNKQRLAEYEQLKKALVGLIGQSTER